MAPASVTNTEPRFEISRHSDRVLLSGHTFSADHERELLEVAKNSFPQQAIELDFSPLGPVPAHWAETTAQTVYLIAETRTARAVVSADELRIRGVTDDEFGWQSRLTAVTAAMSGAVHLDTDMLLIDATNSATDACARSFSSFDAGPINFEESGERFRPSAYPRLDRVVALGRACARASIRVTGHTDGSGNAAFNQQLSKARAEAVGDYLIASGIAADRLQLVGAGSLEPIADNATRFGRSLNRRIEIEFIGTD